MAPLRRASLLEVHVLPAIRVLEGHPLLHNILEPMALAGATSQPPPAILAKNEDSTGLPCARSRPCCCSR
eukprot:11157391-Lingulodinium_polyedra.AAC.1